MEAQLSLKAALLSLKAALPLDERIATASDRCSETGPCIQYMDDRYTVVPFIQIRSRYPIPRPHGQAMGYFLWDINSIK